MSACLPELYHKLGDFVVVKLVWEFSQFSTPFILSHHNHKHKPIYTTNNHTSNTTITAPITLIIIYCTTPHTTA